MIEFHPTVISCEIDGINYILLHGHKGISRKRLGHLLGFQEKRGLQRNTRRTSTLYHSETKCEHEGKVQYSKDDSVDHIRMHARSLFTGNGYSEDLGFTSNAEILNNNNGRTS
jgi:hypothetical protein